MDVPTNPRYWAAVGALAWLLAVLHYRPDVLGTQAVICFGVAAILTKMEG